MSKNTVKKSKNVTVESSRRTANIIAIIVVAIAALFLVAIGVLCIVRVDPLDKLDKPDANNAAEYYDFYNLGTSEPMSSNEAVQSKLRNIMDSMDFNVMNAILQWHWDYSYNFVRDKDGAKTEWGAAQVQLIRAATDAYMVEVVYKNAEYDEKGELIKSSAHSLEVDGETIYFDRVKVVIVDTDNSVGLLTLYPYLYDRVHNQAADGGLPYATYKMTPVTVRANTTDAFDALGELATEISRN